MVDLIRNMLDTVGNDNAHEVIGSFLEGKQPGYGMVEGWVSRVVRAKGWGMVPKDDVKQETLAALLLNFRANKYRGDGSLKSYVQGIAFVQCASALRKLKREREGQENYTNLPSKGPRPTPQSELLGKEDLGIFRDVWMSLSERCREVLFSKYILGLPYKEIAPRLFFSENYCKRFKHECLRTAQKLARKRIGR